MLNSQYIYNNKILLYFSIVSITIFFSNINLFFSDINLFEMFSMSSSDIFLLSSLVPLKVYSNADTMKESIIKDNYKKAGIYRWINNITEDCYVGSSVDLSNRLRLYYNYDFISDKNKGKSMIHAALIKYGYSNFTLEILEYCDADKVIEREQYYLDTLNPEYNILKTAGNSVGFKHSDETKLKMSATRLGFNHSEETKLKFKEVRKGTNAKENNPFFGKTHTEENKLLLSAIAKNRTKLHRSTPVILTDSEHNLIQEFKSMSALALFLKADRARLAECRDNNLLFRNKYYIKPVTNQSEPSNSD